MLLPLVTFGGIRMLLELYFVAQAAIAGPCGQARSLSELTRKANCVERPVEKGESATVRLQYSFATMKNSASVVITGSDGVTSVDRFAECRDLSIDPQEYQSLTDIVVCDGQRLSVEATADGVEIFDTRTQRAVFGVDLEKSITMINGFPRPIE